MLLSSIKTLGAGYNQITGKKLGLFSDDNKWRQVDINKNASLFILRGTKKKCIGWYRQNQIGKCIMILLQMVKLMK
jgi:hypothetical protein